MYIRWIENSLTDKSKFDVLVAVIDDLIEGFITLIKKSETVVEISLLAVSQESRGKGIGKQLIVESISRSKEAGLDEIRVTTQLDNIPAMSLYKSANFKIIESINIYHLWNL
ncbi:GNAT family N-acetyltransferase [Flavobacterium gyeonganense]|uniref:GNAT family N-acetyltransferase n=1 Tax=Flavobacterium gyeonganense TaxID=1310418 RepID=UPI0030F76ADB